MTKDKYITIDLYQMNEKYKEGYELVQIINEYHTTMENCYGNFMSNPINLNIPITRSFVRAVMKLSKPAEILHGEKRNENNS